MPISKVNLRYPADDKKLNIVLEDIVRKINELAASIDLIYERLDVINGRLDSLENP
jgi:hypothetical protein